MNYYNLKDNNNAKTFSSLSSKNSTKPEIQYVKIQKFNPTFLQNNSKYQNSINTNFNSINNEELYLLSEPSKRKNNFGPSSYNSPCLSPKVSLNNSSKKENININTNMIKKKK